MTMWINGTQYIDFDGGTLDNVVIGSGTPAAGAFTTLSASGNSTLTGAVGFGAAPSAARWLNVTPATSGSANQYGAFISPTVSAEATGTATGVYARVLTAAVAFTAANVAAIKAANATKGAGSTISTQYGVYVEPMTVGSTNWAVYTAGTTASYHGGDVVLAATAKLRPDGSAIGDTYITESSANVLDLYAGAAKQLSLTATTATVAGAFGCNGAAAQAAYASGGALAAYSTGAFGFDSDAHASELHAMVVKLRAALVANGIMS